MRERIVSAWREALIRHLCRKAVRLSHGKARDPLLARITFLRMSWHIGQRTPAQVARMERRRRIERRAEA